MGVGRLAKAFDLDQLLVMYQLTQAPDVLDRLMRELMPLSRSIATRIYYRYARGHCHLSADDLMQQSLYRITGSLLRFDSSKGVPLRSYLATRMSWIMIDYIRDTDFVPRQTFKKAKKDRKIRIKVVKSLDAPMFADGTTLGNMLENTLSYDMQSSMEEREGFEYLLKGLSYQEKRVMRMYYGKNIKMKEIGELMGYSEAWVSQLLARSIGILRARMT